MTSGRPGPSGEDARRLNYGTDNQVTGEVHGALFQTGDVAGGIHNHFHYHGTAPTPPARSQPFIPPPAMPAAVSHAVPVRARRKWPRAVGEWLLSFAPIFLLAVVPGGIAMSVVGDGSVGARLASLVIGLAIVGLTGLMWWLVTRRHSDLSLGMFMLASLDRLAFKRLDSSGAPALICVIVIFGGAGITGLGQQPQPSTDGGPSGVPFALVFCALVVLVAVRRLKRG
ncbi:hypothetical protein [Kutzneria sp. CA-103260]|uniref:hypothetical protein n=1 Tax=Kutzneria sp. CA-103260 TaxID=2802641 RepID=UPI001BA7A717|nr:hypothetical protein [Kutzneria sp. CA-103260]QUQ71430.1 hypothetical protein JJ691_92170 [Kutzneria sp. CA-103260]